MGNKILGRRSRSFYKGFNQRQVEYLKQKFQLISKNGKLDSGEFIKSYKVSDVICERFLAATDFDESSGVDQYEFICMVHSLCCQSVSELGKLLFEIITKKKQKLIQKNLLQFTKTCLEYNAYIQKTPITQKECIKKNKQKFQKYNYDAKEGSTDIDEKQFISICLKDEDYKKWMFNMGFITKRQMDYQEDIYDLVDSDIGEEIDRLDKQIKSNVSKIKNGIEHRLDDDQFQMQQIAGDQSAPKKQQPWNKQTQKISISQQNLQPPNQSLQIQYIFGYRSYDCRNNVKFDNDGKIIYHQAAVGIVFDYPKNEQKFINQHHDDITCLDVLGNTVVTGETGSNPMVIVWESPKKNEQSIKPNLIITDGLKDGILSVSLFKTDKQAKIAVICNDPEHRLVIYDLNKLKARQQNPTLADRGIIASGTTTPNLPFGLKFDASGNYVILATLRQLVFITFDKGVLNANRGQFGTFTVSSALCLETLTCRYKNEEKKFIISGMGNGSIYFWQNQTCFKAISGHNGSVSSLCLRRDKKSFISGDKTGNIIIWNSDFTKQYSLNVPKSNSISNMIVSLSNRNNQLLVGTKGSDIYVLKIGDKFDKAEKVMSGHSDGILWGLAVHSTQGYAITGGEDRRLIKWDYLKRKVQKQRKCLYPIRSIDLFIGKDKESFLVVGYKNGIVECFNPSNLQSLQKKYAQIKNPDEEVLNLVRINQEGTMCAVCYQYPNFCIRILNMVSKQIVRIGEIKTSSKIIALDFDKVSNYIRFNTAKFEYMIYDISGVSSKKQPVEVKKITDKKYQQAKSFYWSTHTLPFSAQTKGIFAQGVQQSDITSLQLSRRYPNVFVMGDKYSKIKLFNYPSKENNIFNKYVGHSNEVTGIEFDKIKGNQHLISIGGEEKSIIVWKYNSEQLKNQWFIEKLGFKYGEEIEETEQVKKQRKRKEQLLKNLEGVEMIRGEQAMAVKAFVGQMKPPTDFKQNYNAKKDNKIPDEDLSISHVFGLRNKYISDQVRNQVKFGAGQRHVLFPTACLGVKMKIQTREQEFYHEHRQDIVSFAVDNSRKFMATGQMAQKNPLQPRKKIVCIYVWDIQTKKVLNKLDGFHTIAVVLLSFSPDSTLLFSVGNDQKNSFAIYDWKSGTIIHSGPTSRGKVNGIAWMNNSEFMTCGMDNVKFWSGSKSLIGRTHNDFKKQQRNGAFFSCVASKRVYISGSGKGGLYNWLGNNSGPKINAHSGKVHTIVYYNDFVYSGGADGKIFRWKTESNGQIKIAEKFYDTRQAFNEFVKKISDVPQQIQNQYGVLSIDFGKNKDEYVIGTVGASIIYHTSKRSQVIHQGHYRGQLWALSTQASNNENLIITGGDDRTVRMWDIKAKKEISRAYFSDKIRGLDWASDGSKIVVADDKARVYLYNGTNLQEKPILYEGQLFRKNNTKDSKGAFVQAIKFSPKNDMVAYGCHGQSATMQILDVNNKKLTLRKNFTAGSSAVLHIDWSRDSRYISINTQAYQLLFFDSNGNKTYASALADEKWATWTRKIGFQAKGIFQGVDYTDVNTVCRDPDSQFMAVGYDDQCIRLFKYPAYIEKQVHKVYPGHSSHVTRIQFTQQKMVSLGGLDRTIIVWDVKRQKKKVSKGYNSQSDDGLDDLEDDVDLPNKAVTRKPKKQEVQQFYSIQDEGDQFMAIKPWLGAIKEPTYDYPKQSSKAPNVQLVLQYVNGYRVKDCRQNLYYLDQKNIIFHAAAVLIYHNVEQNTQELRNDHNDDILSIDFHRPTNQVITGELGPKPLVCLYQNSKLTMQFHAPVKKGVLAVAISPDGRRAACAGLDDDHHVAVLDLKTGKVLACEKGTKKVITKIVWTSNNNFVTVGICHYKYWTFDNKLSGKQSPKRNNFVCVAFDDQTQKVYTGASKGTIVVWNKSDPQKQPISLSRTVKDASGQKAQQFEMPASVVDCLQLYKQKRLLIAGTKDGSIFVIDKINKSVLKQIKLESILERYKSTCPKSYCPGIRSINIFKNKMLVGTLGAQIYQLAIEDLTNKVRQISDCKNILKCHFSPNNTWTNEVWGLDIHDDYIFTCSDDATVRCWSLSKKKLLSCASTNELQDGTILTKDKVTQDFTDAAKSRAVCVSPNGEQIIVGAKDGTVRVYQFNTSDNSMILKNVFRHAKEWISDIKFGYNTLIIGSHDNAIYVYSYEQGKIKKKYAPLKKHSSYITHMDVSKDSCFLQSTCGAYELLFWDLNNGKQITSGATLLRDQRWQSWTCNLGWPVQGIYPKVTDGTFINAVHRSNRSINNTLDKQDSVSPYLLAAGNDNGKVAVYNYPCTIKSSSFVQGKGHSSHVTNVKWSLDDRYIVSVGGQDQCLMYWRVNKNKK